VSSNAGPVPVTGGLLARSPYSFVNALNTRHLEFDAVGPGFVKAKNGVGFSPMLYQNVENKSHFLLPLNCAWTSVDVPIGIHLRPLDSSYKVFVRVLKSELAKIDLKIERLSTRWPRRNIIIKDVEELEEAKAAGLLSTPPLLLILKYSENTHFRGFSVFSRSRDFRTGEDILRDLEYCHTCVDVDRFNIYRVTITPALTEDQACFREIEIIAMRFQVDIKRKVEPIELVVLAGFRNNDFAIRGWGWHSESHARIQLESFANDYTAKSDCTVLVDCNEPIKIALRPAPSQHRWNVETPVKEVTVTLTL
jgi:hypothetical protein